jgi:phosphatidylserine decarboxylase
MFHKEGFKIITISSLLFTCILADLCFLVADYFVLKIVVSFLISDLWFIILQFFRNPKRPIPTFDENLIYAPADGKVVVIEEVFENECLNQKCIQVSIFMSPFNVHVNRNPVSGLIKYYKYHPGKFLMAWNPKSSTDNERTTIVYSLKSGKDILIRQIAGFLARRIICYAETGQVVKQGEDIGFIRFGSRVDLLLPLDVNINVKIGDVVTGNKSVIAEIKE